MRNVLHRQTENIKASVAFDGSRALSRLFLTAFLCSCFLFWWLVSFLYRVVLKVDDPVSNWSIGVSIVSALLFIAGFVLPHSRKPTIALSEGTLNRCEVLSYKLTVLLFVPAVALSLAFAVVSYNKLYGQGGQIGSLDQLVYYLHLFCGFMYLGVVDATQRSKRRILVAVILVVLPRVIISLHYGRVFLAQGVVPIAFIAVARGWIRLSTKRMLEFGALGLFILFVPAITRGDRIFGGDQADETSSQQEIPQVVKFLAAGGSLNVFEEYLDLDVSQRCPVLMVSLTDKIIPYTALQACTLRLYGREVSANLDRLVTYEIGGDRAEFEGGTGTSYLLELYLTGRMPAVVFGSLVFGFISRLFTMSLAGRSVFSGIWAECLMRAIFAPRSMLGYVFEKIPVLVFATTCVVLVTFLFSHNAESQSQSPVGS